MWGTMDVGDVLELLGPSYAVPKCDATTSSIVRNFGVQQLDMGSDADLWCYMAQLVQAIKFEDLTSDSINSVVQCPLVECLIKRAVDNP